MTGAGGFAYSMLDLEYEKAGVISKRGVPSLALGFPIGVSSIPVGTRLSPESLVCYTFVEQMAVGIVARPGKCGYSCGVLAEKVAPYEAA